MRIRPMLVGAIAVLSMCAVVGAVKTAQARTAPSGAVRAFENPGAGAQDDCLHLPKSILY